MTRDTEERLERMENLGTAWDADADYITHGPRDEALVRRQVERSQRLEQLFRSIGSSWYQIRYPTERNTTNPIDSNTRVSVEGDAVRFEWTTYWHGDYEQHDFEFPLAWTWDEDWETKAFALRDEQTQTETNRYLTKARKEAADRLQHARHNFEHAQRKASELGVIDAG